MKRILICLFVILGAFNITAQTISASTFNLLGKINIGSAKILLIPIADSSYYPENIKVMKGSISKGRFSFKGLISYPSAFILQVTNDFNKLLYVSDIFFIDKGTQSIKCNINVVRENPEISNVTTKEKKENYDKGYSEIDKEFSDFYRRQDSLFNIYRNNLPVEISANFSKEYKSLTHKRDLVLLKYVKKHRDSFLALWELVGKVNAGYRPIFDSIYSQFSSNLKQTVTGKRLNEQLRTSAILSIGKKFPLLLLQNLKFQKRKMVIDMHKKYTLIDFWFSHCFPCISQFDDLKNLYKKYNKNDLDILSISVDDSAHINDWKKVIAKFNLPWKQYLDLNGKEANFLSIHAFPTNFLLDKTGTIIETNIEPSELRLLLEKSNQ